MKKKRFILREWVENLLEIAIVFCMFLIITTIDSDWTIQYGVFVAINILIITINIILLNKYTK